MVRGAGEPADPAIVVIDEPTGSFDEWLASLRGPAPLKLSVSAAQLLAEARAEAEDDVSGDR